MIESYCDSDEEVFFGPMTMREVKVIFNIPDDSKKRKEDADRRRLAGPAPADSAPAGVVLAASGEQHRTSRPHLQHFTSGEGCADGNDTQLGSSDGSQYGANGGSIGSSCEGDASTCPSDLNHRIIDSEHTSTDDCGSDERGEAHSRSCDLSGSHGWPLDITCTSAAARPGSPALSSCGDMNDTLAEINKLLALDESSRAALFPQGDVESRVVQVSGVDGDVPMVDARFSQEINELTAHVAKPCSINTSNLVDHLPVASGQGSDVGQSHSRSSGESRSKLPWYGDKVGSSTDDLDKSAALVGFDVSSDKENRVSRTPSRSGGARVVFAPPQRPVDSIQRSTARKLRSPGARGRYAVQSPVGVYIRSSPAPTLVQNVRPSPRRIAKSASTSDHKVVRVEVPAASSSLPVVRYASKAARVLVSEPPHSSQKLPLSVKKLINTPEPIVTRHQGRFRLKNLPELHRDVSGSDAEVSILVQKTALK